MSDFCRQCGASFPHRYGEGRCQACLPRAFAELEAANFGLLNTITSCQITIKELDNRNAELEAKNTFWACKNHTNNHTLRCAICDEKRIEDLEAARLSSE